MIKGLLTVAVVAVGTLALNVIFDWATGYPGRVAAWRYRRHLRSICPHSVVSADATCQVCGRRGVERIQSGCIDGSESG